MYLKLLICFILIFSSLKADLWTNDFSRLSNTQIREQHKPASYQEIRNIVAHARKHKLPVCIAGQRHSQGGHTSYKNACVIDIKNLNKIIHFDQNQRLVTVQSGVRWKQLQEFLNPYGYAVKVMQLANIFTIGGALSVNANGIDPHYGPLIETVRAIRIMLYDGSIKQASRTENTELFRLAIGGYGLFGIILEADIEVTENCLYKRTSKFISIESYREHVKQFCLNHKDGLHLAQAILSPSGKDPISSLYVIDYIPYRGKKNKRPFKLSQERFVGLNRWGMSWLRSTSIAKRCQILPELWKNKTIISRNNCMRPPAEYLRTYSKRYTDLLQEYFIPLNNFDTFFKELRELIYKEKILLLYLALRFIPAQKECILSYTPNDMIGVVIFFSQKLTDSATQHTRQWTRKLIDLAIKSEGTYYLPIQLHATYDQLKKAYPNITTFFTLKDKYDPDSIFINHFYQQYVHEIRNPKTAQH